jgi:hypothetical protein
MVSMPLAWAQKCVPAFSYSMMQQNQTYPVTPIIQYDFNIFCSLRGVPHVASSAIGNSMIDFKDKALLDEIHIGIASLENSSHSFF